MSIENLTPQEILDLSITDAFPQIFNQGMVFVLPSTPIKNTALFFIPLRELYVNGMVVMDKNGPIGRIAPKHILKKVLEVGIDQCLKIESKDVMVGLGREIKENFAIATVLEFFQDTNFGFAPVIRNNALVGTISTRDFLPIIIKMNIDRPVKTVSSPLVHINGNVSIRSILEIMSKTNLRKIAMHDGYEFKIIDDQLLLEFLFLLEKNKPNILDTNINVLPKSNVEEIDPNTSISEAAQILLEKDMLCAIHDYRIVTSWDLVMKVLGQYTKTHNMNETALLD